MTISPAYWIAFSPITQEVDLCEFKPSLSTELAPGQPGLHRGSLYQTNKQTNKTKKKQTSDLLIARQDFRGREIAQKKD